MISVVNFKKLGRLNVTAMFVCSVLAGSLAVFLPAAPAAAEVAVLPEPTAPTSTPSEGCEWMGEFYTVGSHGRFDYPHDPFNPNSEIESYEFHGVTTEIPDESCGLLFSGRLDFIELSFPVPEPCGYMFTRTISAEGVGTGRIEATMSQHDNLPYLDISVLTTSGIPALTTFTECGSPPTEWTHTVPALYSTSDCRGNTVEKVGFSIEPTSQATVGKCTIDTELFNGPLLTFFHSQEISWRFKKIDCDPSVDSDGDGVSDCQEYEDRTNPMDPADYVTHLSPEAQSIIGIAENTESQCFGQVTKMGAKDAAAGKGVKNVFEYWDLAGIPGVTEDATFQDKMAAVRQYCKEN